MIGPPKRKTSSRGGKASTKEKISPTAKEKKSPSSSTSSHASKASSPPVYRSKDKAVEGRQTGSKGSKKRASSAKGAKKKDVASFDKVDKVAFEITIEGGDGQVLAVTNAELNSKQMATTLEQLLVRPVLVACKSSGGKVPEHEVKLSVITVDGEPMPGSRSLSSLELREDASSIFICARVQAERDVTVSIAGSTGHLNTVVNFIVDIFNSRGELLSSAGAALNETW